MTGIAVRPLGDPSWRVRAEQMRGRFEAKDSVGAAVAVITAAAAGGINAGG